MQLPTLLLLLGILPSSAKFELRTLSSGLKNAAKLLRGSINESVDPCDNFFKFSCGQWIAENPIPKDRSYYDRYTKLSESINNQMKALYNDQTPSSSTSINKMKQFYRTCMNTSLLRETKTDELLNNLKQIGYWPIIHGDKWDAKSFDVTDRLIRIAKIRPLDIFFASYGNVDLYNVSRLLIHFDKGSLGMSIPQFYMDDSRFAIQMSAYKQYMQRIVMLIARDAHFNLTKEQLLKDVDDIVLFEKRFATITIESINLANFSAAFQAHRLSDMTSYMPTIDWLEYFLRVMPKEMEAYLRADPEVIIANPKFFVYLNKLLTETDNRTLMNVMGWRFADAYWLQLDERFGSVRHDYMRRIVGQSLQTPRWKECTAVLNAALPYASDAMFIRKFFKENNFEIIQRMFDNLKHEFMMKLMQTQWMDQVTQNHAIQKLNWLPNDTYASIVQKHSLWRQHVSSLNLLKPVDLSLFPIPAITVNAAYTFVRNALTIPAAILQIPFFNAEFPMALNFGSIGSIIAHEIVHGFDLQGSQFEKNGNRRNWWQTESKKRFIEKIRCIIEQYSEYKVDGTNGLKVDGFASNSENAADNSGISTSYQAYQKFLANHPEEKNLKIPGFEKYNHRQLFFISFAMSYCGHAKREETIRQLFSDNHSPSQYRINGVVSNQPEFAEAFNCPTGSPMNPVRKCLIW